MSVRVKPCTVLCATLRIPPLCYATSSVRGMPIPCATAVRTYGPKFGMRHEPRGENSVRNWRDGYGLVQFVQKGTILTQFKCNFTTLKPPLYRFKDVKTSSQGCGSAFIFCGSGSRSYVFLKADPDPDADPEPILQNL